LGLAIQFLPQNAALRAHGARFRVDVDPLHRREINHHSGVDRRAARDVVFAAADGDFQVRGVGQLDGVGDVGRAMAARNQCRAVGVGIPGTLSPATGLVKNANSTWLIGRPLAEDLPRILDRPVRFANDANCFALSEATDGAAAGASVVFGVILGTGVGGGIVVNGRVLAGANAIAGEWGHNPLPWLGPDEWPGPPCYCGKRGCVEAWLS